MESSLLSVRVASKKSVAQDIISLDFVSSNGDPLPAFEPGAHIDVYAPGGFIRQYSLLNDSKDHGHYVIGVLREAQSRGGSIALHDQVQEGDILQISPPRNRFALVPADHSVLFAGGIGITPLLCMVRRLQDLGAAFDLHYSCRSRARAAFLDSLQDLIQAGRAYVHFDDEPGTALDLPGVLADVGADQDAQIYVCGPTGYLDYIQSQAKAHWIDEARIHVERFSLDEADRPEITQEDVAFQVELASTGEVFDIPADETITSALDRQGVYIPVSCEEGICGTCLTGIVEGIPDHRDSYLTDEEHAANDQFTPCCSRAKTPKLILDL